MKKKYFKISQRNLFIASLAIMALLVGATAVRAAVSSNFWSELAEYAGITLGNNLSSQVNQEKVTLGSTDFTRNTQSMSYTDGGDWKQNLGAMSERMASGTQYQLLQANSVGVMQRVNGLTSFVESGAVVSFTTTSAITAAQLCDSGVFTATIPLGAATLTLPATSTLFADCLATNGDSLSISIINLGTVTSTVIAAGTGGTLKVSSSTTILAGTQAYLDVVRTTDIAYRATLLNATN